MTVRQLVDTGLYNVINVADGDREISGIFCCDLLSIAMGKAPEGCAWVTVMSNVNTLAVATLADAAVVVLAEGVKPDATVIAKAAEQQVTLLTSDRPIFESALRINELIREKG